MINYILFDESKTISKHYFHLRLYLIVGATTVAQINAAQGATAATQWYVNAIGSIDRTENYLLFE